MYISNRRRIAFDSAHWRYVFRRITLLLCVWAAIGSLSASASSTATGGTDTTVSVGLISGYGGSVLHTRGGDRPFPPFFLLVGSVVWPTDAGAQKWFWPNGADIYFGVMLTGGTDVYTWSHNSAGPKNTLNKGWVPYARSVPPVGTFVITDPSGLNTPMYSLSGNEPPGLYQLFLLLVKPGADPSDTTQWNKLAMHPFLVK
jgi:hypothetical protein